jgi:hypothetical protein
VLVVVTVIQRARTGKEVEIALAFLVIESTAFGAVEYNGKSTCVALYL